MEKRQKSNGGRQRFEVRGWKAGRVKHRRPDRSAQIAEPTLCERAAKGRPPRRFLAAKGAPPALVVKAKTER